jgi:hypothetical protein
MAMATKLWAEVLVAANLDVCSHSSSPATLVRWHRSGFYWRWKSRHRVGWPAISVDIRDLAPTISCDNPLWGAPRIHG